MEFRLLVLDEADGKFHPAVLPDGKPQLLEVSAVPDYWQQIGRNTRYVIHPEEILADNFVLLIHPKPNAPPPTPAILEKLRALLARRAE
jgi:hypothetical protein